MSLNNTTPTTYSSALLIADTYTLPNGSNDSLPPFTLVNGFPVSACLELQSTLGALLISRMTTAQRRDLNVTNGMIVYDTDIESFMFFENGAWVNIPGVVIPTVINDIATFNDTLGTIKDSGVRLLQNFAQQTLFLGENTGNTTARDGSNSVVAFGLSTLTSITNGSAASVCVGNGVGFHATNVDSCTFVGDSVADAPAAGTLIELTGIGASTLSSVLGGAARLTAVGAFSMEFATTAFRCTSLGWNSLHSIVDSVTAADSTAVGSSCMILATTALRTTAIGSASAAGQLSYTDCTFVGEATDNLSNALTGTTAIGKGATVGASNSTAIGINATVSTANSMVLGAIGTQVGIGTTAPNAQLHVVHNIGFGSVILPMRVDQPQSTINVTYDDFIVQGGQAETIFNLPVADANHVGQVFILKKANSGNLQTIVNATGGQQIDGAAYQVSIGGWGSYRVYTDGSNWFTF